MGLRKHLQTCTQEYEHTHGHTQALAHIPQCLSPSLPPALPHTHTPHTHTHTHTHTRWNIYNPDHLKQRSMPGNHMGINHHPPSQHTHTHKAMHNCTGEGPTCRPIVSTTGVRSHVLLTQPRSTLAGLGNPIQPIDTGAFYITSWLSGGVSIPPQRSLFISVTHSCTRTLSRSLPVSLIVALPLVRNEPLRPAGVETNQIGRAHV